MRGVGHKGHRLEVAFVLRGQGVRFTFNVSPLTSSFVALLEDHLEHHRWRNSVFDKNSCPLLLSRLSVQFATQARPRREGPVPVAQT